MPAPLTFEQATERLAVIDGVLAGKLRAFFYDPMRTRSQVASLVGGVGDQVLPFVKEARDRLDPQHRGVPQPELYQGLLQVLGGGRDQEIQAAWQRAQDAYDSLNRSVDFTVDAFFGTPAVAGLIPVWRRLADEQDMPVDSATLRGTGAVLSTYLLTLLDAAAKMQSIAPLFRQIEALNTWTNFLETFVYNVTRLVVKVVEEAAGTAGAIGGAAARGFLSALPWWGWLGIGAGVLYVLGVIQLPSLGLGRGRRNPRRGRARGRYTSSPQSRRRRCNPPRCYVRTRDGTYGPYSRSSAMQYARIRSQHSNAETSVICGGPTSGQLVRVYEGGRALFRDTRGLR